MLICGISMHVAPSPINPGPQMHASHGGLLHARSSRIGTQRAFASHSLSALWARVLQRAKVLRHVVASGSNCGLPAMPWIHHRTG